MKQISKRLTYANVMSSLAVFLVLGGATAFAATKLAKNSVSTKQLKKNSVTSAKIKKNAITTAKIKNGAVTGPKVNVSTLPTVPSATTASNLTGFTRFNFKLGFGQTQTILTAGPFTWTASCLQNTTDFNAQNNRDIARILISTNANGQVFDARSELRGDEAGKFLNTNTPEKERVWNELSIETGKAYFESGNVGDGSAYSPSGVAVSFGADGEGIGVNVFGPGCFFHGYVVVEG